MDNNIVCKQHHNKLIIVMDNNIVCKQHHNKLIIVMDNYMDNYTKSVSLILV